MAILFELSESIIKQAALIAAKYPGKTLLSVIEECFNYGAKSLYTDAPKPVPPKRVYDESAFSVPVKDETLSSLKDSIYDVMEQAKQEVEEIDGVFYDDIPDDYGTPIIQPNGNFEL